jgi:hypothetical protein
VVRSDERANRYEAEGKSNLCDAASALLVITSPVPFELFPLQFSTSARGIKSFFAYKVKLISADFPHHIKR